MPLEFEIEDHYANVLLIISTGVIFGGGIQIMMPIVLICLTIRYFYWKFTFIRFCKVPNIYNEILNDRIISILKVVLIIRCLISLYMFGADDVFAMEKSAFMKWVIWSYYIGLFIRSSCLQICLCCPFQSNLNLVL